MSLFTNLVSLLVFSILLSSYICLCHHVVIHVTYMSCHRVKGCLAALAFLRYRQGVTEDFLPAGYEPGAGQSQVGGVPAAQSPFSGYSAGGGGDMTDSFQHQQPFSGAQHNAPPTVGGSNFRAYWMVLIGRRGQLWLTVDCGKAHLGLSLQASITYTEVIFDFRGIYIQDGCGNLSCIVHMAQTII